MAEPPALCSKCLGPDPYLTMLRDPMALECKLCATPFDVYKWKNQGKKHTVVCLKCSKLRNCCQCCLLDLTFGITTQMRDEAMKLVKDKGGDVKEVLTKLAKATTTSAVKSKKVNEEDNKRLKDVDVNKLVAKLPFNGPLTSEDKELRTLFVFGVDSSLPEYKISDWFAQFGEVKSMNCQHQSRCAFVTFKRRSDAEKAMTHVKSLQTVEQQEKNKAGLIVIDNIPMRVCWGKERPLGSGSLERLKIGEIVGKVMKKMSKDEAKPVEKLKPREKDEVKTKEEEATKKEIKPQPLPTSIPVDYEF